jgi:hypothetical protein
MHNEQVFWSEEKSKQSPFQEQVSLLARANKLRVSSASIRGTLLSKGVLHKVTSLGTQLNSVSTNYDNACTI